ncbi:hypothetical protein AB3N59_19410 [Leptospira sp. WS92.C1]
MSNIYPIITCNNVNIIENREYVQFFDEPVNVYNDRCNKLFYFILEYNFQLNTGKLEIPNCGGHVDSMPKSFKQLNWTESALISLSFNQTWTTNWILLNIESYSRFIENLLKNGSILQSIYYSCNLSNINTVFSHIYNNNMNINKIRFYNDNNVFYISITDTINIKLKELARMSTNNVNHYHETLVKIINTNDLLIDSKIRVDLSIE